MTLHILDLFAGCGGLSLGMSAAGHVILAAVEKDQWAAETFSTNMPRVEVLCRDIRDIDTSFLRERFGSSVDTVVGGPPCQGFSVSGQRQYGISNPENMLVYEYIRVVEALRPKLFVLENVRGFTSATIEGRSRALHEILKKLTAIGYEIRHRIMSAVDYGIPQQRTRLFVVGSIDGFAADPFPSSQHGNGIHRVTLWDAIGDLPPITAGEGTDGPQAYGTVTASEYARRLRQGSGYVFNHEAMQHTPRLIERFAGIPPGGKGYDIGRKTAHRHKVTVYKSNNQRLLKDQPSLCITANWQSSYIHPTLNRNLTVREAARIQSFPDSFVFKGRRALMSSKLLRREGRLAEMHISQCHQVGNAVAPLLAEQLAATLARLDSMGGRSKKHSLLEDWI